MRCLPERSPRPRQMPQNGLSPVDQSIWGTAYSTIARRRSTPRSLFNQARCEIQPSSNQPLTSLGSLTASLTSPVRCPVGACKVFRITTHLQTEIGGNFRRVSASKVSLFVSCLPMLTTSNSSTRNTLTPAMELTLPLSNGRNQPGGMGGLVGLLRDGCMTTTHFHRTLLQDKGM